MIPRIAIGQECDVDTALLGKHRGIDEGDRIVHEHLEHALEG